VSFFFVAAWRLWRVARANDVVVAKTDPPLLSVMAAPIVWLRGARLVNWLQDIFPEVAEALQVGGRLGKIGFRLIRPLRNWSLASARLNVVVSEGMANQLHRQGVAPEKIRIIPNWSGGAPVKPISAEGNELRKAWGLNGQFVVGYAGNLGRPHDLGTIIEAATLLQEMALGSETNEIAQRIVFVFIGGGIHHATLEREVMQRKLTNVRIYPYQPRERLAETLSVADLHLISLNPKLEGLIVPSKFYGIAAAGRPSLFIGAANGEIAQLLSETGCGFTVAPCDGNDLMKRILQLASDSELCADMGARARAAYEQRWETDRRINEWRQVLTVAAEPTSQECNAKLD
jgi:glycosyltransferase involved in cell wall biosynthesis